MKNIGWLIIVLIFVYSTAYSSPIRVDDCNLSMTCVDVERHEIEQFTREAITSYVIETEHTSTKTIEGHETTSILNYYTIYTSIGGYNSHNSNWWMLWYPGMFMNNDGTCSFDGASGLPFDINTTSAVYDTGTNTYNISNSNECILLMRYYNNNRSYNTGSYSTQYATMISIITTSWFETISDTEIFSKTFYETELVIEYRDKIFTERMCTINDSNPVPESSTFLLFGIGIFSLLLGKLFSSFVYYRKIIPC